MFLANLNTLFAYITALMADSKFDLKLIPEFDGSDQVLTIIEWSGKAELFCDLCGVKNIASVLPL